MATMAGNATANLLGNLSGNAALPKNQNEKSQTQSVISPATITITGSGNAAQDEQSQRTATELTSRDPKTANDSLKNTLTLQQASVLERDIVRQRENQEAAQLVGAVLANVVGDLSKSMRQPVDDARSRQYLDSEAERRALTAVEQKELARLELAGVTPEKAAQTLADPVARATHDKWAEGSPAKIALHGIVGLIEAKIGDGGAAAGALVGMAHEALIPAMRAYLNDQDFDETTPERKREFDALMNAGSALLGAGIGAMASGNVRGASTGASVAFIADVNNRQLHPREIDLIVARAKEFAARMSASGEPMKVVLRY